VDIGKILTKAWQIIWKHKILWVFGILAGCGASTTASNGGGGGGGSGPVTYSVQSGDSNGFSQFGRTVEDFVFRLSEIPVWIWILLAVILIVVGILLSIAAFMLGNLGTVGVVAGTAEADEAEPDGKPLSIKQVFSALKPHYWKVLLLHLGVSVAGMLIGFVIFIPLLIFALCTCGFGMFLLIPLGWFVQIMLHLTTIAIVIEDKTIFGGIERAWQIFTRHLGNVVVMSLILGIGQIIIGLFIGLPILLTSLPLLINLFASGFQSFTIGLVISGILFLVYLPVLILLSGVVKAYVLASWTLTFRRLSEVEKLVPVVLSKKTGKES